MNRNGSLIVIVTICLLVACAFVSCGTSDSDKPGESGTEPETGELGRVDRETVIASGNLELKATVTVPARTEGQLVPGAVIVHSFSHVDRDATFTQGDVSIKPYKDLADQLAARGIATVRFDKRTIPPYAAKLNASEMTLEDYYPDALAALELLRSTKGVDPKRLYFIGHGEGAVTTTAVAKADPELGLHGLVLIAPPLMAYDELITHQYMNDIHQIELQLKHNPGLRATRGPELQRKSQELDAYIAAFKMLREGDGWPDGYALNAFYEKYWRHALELYAGNLDRIKQLELPILIVQGNLDLTVLAADLLRVRAELEATGHVTVYLQDGAKHYLVDHSTLQVPTAAIDTIAAWLLNPAAPAKPAAEE